MMSAGHALDSGEQVHRIEELAERVARYAAETAERVRQATARVETVIAAEHLAQAREELRRALYDLKDVALDERAAEVFWRNGFEAGRQEERDRHTAARKRRPRPGTAELRVVR